MMSPISTLVKPTTASGKARGSQESKDSIEAFMERIDYLHVALKDGQAGILGNDKSVVWMIVKRRGRPHTKGLPTGTDVILQINSKPVQYFQASFGDQDACFDRMVRQRVM